MLSPSLQLYRRFLRLVGKFPVPAVRTRLQLNVREVFDLYRRETNPQAIRDLIAVGEQVLFSFTTFQRHRHLLYGCMVNRTYGPLRSLRQ